MGKEWTHRLGMEDRVALKTLLLQCKGTYAQQCLVDKLCEDVLSKEEAKAMNVHTEGGMIVWKTTDSDGKAVPMEKDVSFGPEARALISRNLAMLDEAGVLERMYLGIYRLFMLTPWSDSQ